MEQTEADKLFLVYEPYLWKALAALGRTGFIVPPQDAQDFIHDFFVEEWSGILARFDSERSQFSTYASAAFFRFARRRLMMLHKWQRYTADFESGLEGSAATVSPEESLELREQIHLIREGMKQLPFTEREVLYDFLTTPESTERALAQRHAVTRYRVREILLNGVGRLATGLAPLAPEDRHIARNVWGEGGSTHRAAILSGMSSIKIQAAKQRIVGAPMETLRQFNQRKTMRTNTMIDYIELFKHALFSPHDVASLQLVQQNAPAITGALTGEAGRLTLVEDRLAMRDPEWLVRVYDALGDDAQAPTEENLLAYQKIADMQRNGALHVALAVGTLLALLDDYGYDWQQAFVPLQAPTDQAVARLRSDPSVAAGEPWSMKLLRHGLTPTMLYEAIRGVQLLFDRRCRHPSRPVTQAETPVMSAHDTAAEPLRIRREGAEDVFVPIEHLIAQLGFTPNLPSDAVPGLVDWIRDVVHVQPLLVDGYQYMGGGVFAMLRRDAFDPRHDAVYRWRTAPPSSARLDQ